MNRTSASFVVLTLLVLSMSTTMEVLAERITVFNNLGQFINLNVHCQSSSEDLAHSTIGFGGRYQFETKSDSYDCDLSWVSNLNQDSGTFTLYKKSIDDARCPQSWCFWRVDQNGLYLQLSGARFELEYKWP